MFRSTDPFLCLYQYVMEPDLVAPGSKTSSVSYYTPSSQMMITVPSASTSVSNPPLYPSPPRTPPPVPPRPYSTSIRGQTTSVQPTKGNKETLEVETKTNETLQLSILSLLTGQLHRFHFPVSDQSIQFCNQVHQFLDGMIYMIFPSCEIEDMYLSYDREWYMSGTTGSFSFCFSASSTTPSWTLEDLIQELGMKPKSTPLK